MLGFKQTLAALSKPNTRYALGTILIIGIAIGVIFWGAFNWAIELSNKEAFCISCHEMRSTVYAEYQGTIHDSNRSGVRAICSDCHVPKEWIYKVKRKILATNELFHKIAGSVNTKEKFEAQRLEMAQRVWETMKATDSRECRNCHSTTGMALKKQKPRARAQHESAVEAGETCIDCHKGIAHKPVHKALEETDEEMDFTL